MAAVSVDPGRGDTGSGQANRAERDAHLFPLKISKTSPIRLARLQQAFSLMSRIESAPGADYASLLEGAVALRLVLISGRGLEEIHGLQASPLCSKLRPEWPSPSLVRIKGHEPALWLTAGQAPHPAGHKLASRHAGKISKGVWLGLDQLSQDLLRKYLPEPVSMLPGARTSSWPKLFRSISLANLEAAVGQFRKWAAHELGFGRANALPDLKRCSRFLERQLTVAAFGDPAASWLITNTVPPRNATTSFYTGMSLNKALTFHREAVNCVTGPAHAAVGKRRSTLAPPALLDDLRLGSRYCPVASSLEQLRDRLIAKARIGRGTLTPQRTSEIDHAFTAYCWLFFSLHAGWRPPQRLLPLVTDIDWHTGAFLVQEKARPVRAVVPGADEIKQTDLDLQDETEAEDEPVTAVSEPAPPNDESPSNRRWLPLGERARDQLTAYYRHVDARQKRRLRDAPLECRDEVMAYFRALPGLGWDLPRNFPRHYLRSSLVGVASVEAINAYLGHWDGGAEPWWNGSCLDPIAYTREIQGNIAQLFPVQDWPVLKGFQ
jgi:hypothetical protein